MISNKNCSRHHSPSITARFTSGWRLCCQKRRLLKLGLHVRFFSRAGNATGQISSQWISQNLHSIFVARCFYEVFSCFVFKHMVSAVCMWLIPLHRILFVEWNQRFQIFRRYFVTVSRGRQRRRENSVKMAWHIHTWPYHAIFTSSLTSAFSI